MSNLEHWENRYRTAEYIFGTAPNAFLAKQRSRLPRSGRALAVSDGEGRNGVWLAEQGLEVLSLDFSPTAQEKAQALARERGVTITTELCDVSTWTWPVEAFDVIVLIFAPLGDPKDRADRFVSIKRALRPGGMLLLEGYTPKQVEYGTGGGSSAANMYTRAILEAAFGDLGELEIAEYEGELHEGSRHNGPSALIDMVARKRAI